MEENLFINFANGQNSNPLPQSALSNTKENQSSSKSVNLFIAARVYEMSVKIQSGNDEDIVGIG